MATERKTYGSYVYVCIYVCVYIYISKISGASAHPGVRGPIIVIIYHLARGNIKKKTQPIIIILHIIIVVINIVVIIIISSMSMSTSMTMRA